MENSISSKFGEDKFSKETSYIFSKELQLFLEQFESLNTKLNYKRTINIFFKFWFEKGTIFNDINQITEHHIEIWKEFLTENYSNKSVGTKMATLISFLKFENKRGTLKKEIFKSIELPKIENNNLKQQEFTIEEFKQLIKSLEQKYKDSKNPRTSVKDKKNWLKYTIFMSICNLGLKTTECSFLKIKDVILLPNNSYVVLNLRENSEKIKYISNELKEILENYKVNLRKWAVDDDPFFTLTPYSKKHLSRDYIAKIISDIAKDCGINKQFNPQSCRYFITALMKESGFSIEKIKNFMGHKSILSTIRYFYSNKDEKENNQAIKNPVFNYINNIEGDK